MKRQRKTRYLREDDCIQGWISRYRGFVEAMPILIETLGRDKFLEVHNQFHQSNKAKLDQELQEGARQ